MPKRNLSTKKTPTPKKAKRLNVKELLHDGRLLTGVRLNGVQVTLHLAEAYNQASGYQSVNNALHGLYQISPAFQATFEQPKDGIHAPVLQLKENHDYANEKAILEALKAFAVSQKPLKFKAALSNGTLLTGVTLQGLQVTLDLAAEYDQAKGYKSINERLHYLYRISPAFQATFEQPKLGIHAPVLQLKEKHGYADENAILAALKAFSTPQKPLKFKATLSDGSLLTDVMVDGLQVTLQLQAVYNQASSYKSINDGLRGLYKISPAFQSTFEQPLTGLHAPVLRLKEHHGYADKNAILAALKAFAAPQKPVKVKTVLKDDKFLTGVTLAGLQVSLHLPAACNQASDYKPINTALYHLYQISLAFQATFERPKLGIHAPVLQLKENHGYADENAILRALKAFVAPEKRLNVTAALREGSLLTSVTLVGLQVTLDLAAGHDQARGYKAINKALYDLYRISDAFQATFEQPKLGIHAPVLQLKEKHGYADANAILVALKAFAEHRKSLNVKKDHSDIDDEEVLSALMGLAKGKASEPYSLGTDLLVQLGERLSDNDQQIYPELTSPSPTFRPYAHVDVEAGKVAQTVCETLSEDKNANFNFRIR